MKTFKQFLFVFIFWSLTAVQTLFAQQPTTFIEWEGRPIEVFTDHIEVHFEHYQLKDSVAAKLSIDASRIEIYHRDRGYAIMQIEDGADIRAAVEAVRAVPGVVRAGPSVVVRASAIPNDTHWSLQYGPQITAMPFAWDITTGDGAVTVGVIDSGIPLVQFTNNMSHEDLDNAQRILLGQNFSFDDPDEGLRDLNGHGTHVTGILSAESNNNTGIAGSSWGSQILVVKFFDQFEEGTIPNFFNAVQFAVNMGVDIINFSGGAMADPNNTIRDAVQLADNNGVLLVVAAGNYHQQFNPDRIVEFPAAYSTQFDNVIAVSATNSNDEVPFFSSRGPEVNVSAPGDNIFSTTPDYSVQGVYQLNYDFASGTSMAAPHVSGTAAMMLSVNPNLTPAQLRNRLEDTADWFAHIGSSPPSDEYGHGRLNAYEAVKHALPNQLNSPFFAVWPSQDIGGSHIFGDSYLEFGTLIIPQGKAAVFSGTLTGFGGDYAKILVQGNMVVESGTQLLDLSIEVAPTGRLIVRDGATIRPGSLGELLVEGYARLGSDVVVRRGDIEVAAGGELVVGAGSELYFTTGKGLTAWGRVALNGYNGKPVVMNIDPALSGTWAGVHLHGAGSELAYVHITGAVNGVSAYNTGNISLNSVQVYGSSFDGFRLVNAAADTWNIRADGNLRHGILYDGAANGGVSTSILKGNEYTGIKLEGGAVVWQAQNSRIYDGLTNGIRADDGSYIAVSGSSIHDNAYLAAAS